MVFMRYILLVIPLFGMLNAMGLSEINKATKDELMKIKGIGEAKANLIISSRPFKSMQELDDVKGVGDVLLANIKSDIYKKSATGNSVTESKAKLADYNQDDEPKRKKVNVIHFEK
jgi:competence protein ComEA